MRRHLTSTERSAGAVVCGDRKERGVPQSRSSGHLQTMYNRVNKHVCAGRMRHTKKIYDPQGAAGDRGVDVAGRIKYLRACC